MGQCEYFADSIFKKEEQKGFLVTKNNFLRNLNYI